MQLLVPEHGLAEVAEGGGRVVTGSDYRPRCTRCGRWLSYARRPLLTCRGCAGWSNPPLSGMEVWGLLDDALLELLRHLEALDHASAQGPLDLTEVTDALSTVALVLTRGLRAAEAVVLDARGVGRPTVDEALGLAGAS